MILLTPIFLVLFVAISYLSLGFLGIKKRKDHVFLKGLDVDASYFPIILFGFFIVFPEWFSKSVSVLVLPIFIIVWSGFRIRILVYRNRTIVKRVFLFFIPWRIQRFDAAPMLEIDGWDTDELVFNIDSFEFCLGSVVESDRIRIDGIVSQFTNYVEDLGV